MPRPPPTEFDDAARPELASGDAARENHSSRDEAPTARTLSTASSTASNTARAYQPVRALTAGRALSPHKDARVQGGRSTHVIDAATLLPVLLAPLREHMSLFAFRGFLEPLLPGELVVDENDRCSLTLWAPSAFLADWVSTHYGDALSEGARLLLARQVTITICERPATLKAAADAS